MRLAGAIGERPGCDVLLSLDLGLGEAVEVPARCYAVEGPCVYLHLLDPILGYGLPSGSRVLFSAEEPGLEGAQTPARRGLLERVRDRDLAPSLPADDPAASPVWRVRLDEGGSRPS